MTEPPAHIPEPAALDRHPSEVVQEEIARLKFIGEQVDFAGKSLLDAGCGEGLGCRYMSQRYGAGRCVGVDLSAQALEAAQAASPGFQFVQGDVCDRNWGFEPGRWDRILCCEVFEHVADPSRLVAFVHRHLAPGGVALITTPNRPVFSLGHRPSPMNKDHLVEYDAEEFAAIIGRHFSDAQMWGQRLKSEALFRRRQKIIQRNVGDFRLLGRLYWNRRLRRLWKLVRLEWLRRWIEGASRHAHADFEFVHPPGGDSIWLCAVCRKAGVSDPGETS